MNAIRALFDEMVEYGVANVDKVFTPPDLTKVLRHYAGNIDITVKTKRSARVDLNQVVVGGYYDPNEDEDDFPSIFIDIAFNPEQKTIKVADIAWRDLCADIIECIGHEIVHQEQYRRRNFDIGPGMFISTSEDKFRRDEQEYLGNPDEIEAYGYSIAVQIFLKEKPRSITGKHIQKSAMFQSYAELFGVQHPTVKKLIMYVVFYFNQIKGSSTVKKTKQLTSR